MKLRIIPYKRGSKGARLLAERLSSLLGYKVFRGKPKTNRRNISWGSILWKPNTEWVNDPAKVRIARNKIETFRVLEGVCPIPPWTEDKEVAAEWISAGKKVLARSPTGQAGSGICVCDDLTSLPDAPLYTLYIKKRKEFRVHVFNGQVIAVYEKRRKVGQHADPIVRSHNRGWVFCKQDLSEPDGLRDLAITAVGTLGLDFGGVDIIWNEHQNQCYVLEVNTAPGFSPTTGDAYATAIQSLYA